MKQPYLQCVGEEWQKIRMRVLVRDNFTCQAHTILDKEPCGETKLRKLHVHHILQRQYGGTHDLDNLITVCAACHMDIHPHMKFELPQKQKELGENDSGALFEL